MPVQSRPRVAMTMSFRPSSSPARVRKVAMVRWGRITVATVAGLSLGIGSPGYVRADKADTTTVEFETVSANATLTDCPISGPAGLHCTGIVISAGKNKDNFQTGKFVSVQLYDVELIPGSFVATLIASGVTDSPRLSISDKLSRASVSAIVDLTNCTSDPGAPEPTCTLVRTVDIKVRWFGAGVVTRTHFKDSFESGGCEFEFESDSAVRSATVTATVDGVDMPNSELPQFMPSLSSGNSEQTVKCDQGSLPAPAA